MRKLRRLSKHLSVAAGREGGRVVDVHCDQFADARVGRVDAYAYRMRWEKC